MQPITHQELTIFYQILRLEVIPQIQDHQNKNDPAVLDLMRRHVSERNENVAFAKRKVTQNPIVPNLKVWTEADLILNSQYYLLFLYKRVFFLF